MKLLKLLCVVPKLNPFCLKGRTFIADLNRYLLNSERFAQSQTRQALVAAPPRWEGSKASWKASPSSSKATTSH